MPLDVLTDPASCAVVLSGAGTKGAFEAGALSVLLEAGHRFGAVVGSSAGALNGALLAAASRAGAERAAAQVLPDAWVEHADFFDVFSPSLDGLLHRRGFSGEQKLSDALERQASPWLPGHGREVRLTMVTAALRGRPTEIAGRPGTTFEYPITYANADFDTAEQRVAIWRAATASAAVPLVFLPVDLPGVGPCADGGLVNNTPLKYALADDGVTRVFVIVPYPAPAEPKQPAQGLELLTDCIDVFIQERLQRDLHVAAEVNEQVASIAKLAETDPALADRVRAEMKLGRKRVVELVQIRPTGFLSGSDLGGFGNKALRKAQVAAGVEAAKAALERPL